MPNKRNLLIDHVKGIAIILVVIGHCIQYGSGEENLATDAFFSDKLFKFIYGFHMPLFMAISGYLFFFTTKKDTKAIIVEKLQGIILPLVAWHTLYQGVMILLGTSIPSSTFFFSYFHTLWFLRALFFCCIMTLVIHRFFSDKAYIHITVCCLLYLIPPRIIPNVYVFTATFFIFSYLFNKYQVIQRLYNHNPRLLHITAITLSCLYLILLHYYEKNDYIYLSGAYLLKKDYSFWFMLYTNLYRNLTAGCGCVLVLYLVFVLHRYLSNGVLSSVLTNLSISSLSIYIVNHYLNESVLVLFPVTHINYFYTLLETFVVIGIGYLFYLFCKKWKVTRLLFLGGR